MKTTVILKDDILKEAIEATKVTEKTALIHMGLQELINRAAREKLIALGGTMKHIKTPRRRR